MVHSTNHEQNWAVSALITRRVGRVTHPEKVTHTIQVAKGVAPKWTLQWRQSEMEKKVIKEYVTEMLKEGVIEPATSPWNAPVVVIRRSEGRRSVWWCRIRD